ncbi:hypothetical protein BUALT_Bualt01G0060500 [Buddleja alternifolia]|uniref:Histone-lysine N-methyltransferase n=1 Tax=Buddleja alternifolia TaxID=168488 RepID=A0AAV6Y670_9LAMI|nr:hypothetical protein BUALT_Bualt01G0060500 [Buddleja alternifolia]
MSEKQILRIYGNSSNSTSSEHPSFNFSRSLKRPKVYATRDFPEHCEPAKSLASCSRNYDASVNEAVSPKEEQEKMDRKKVKEALKLFQEIYKHLSDEEKAKRKGEFIGARRTDIEAAERLKKKGKFIHSKKQFGHIPGISIGDRFRLRAELAVIGLHRQYTSGIDYMVHEGKKFATSVVNSGRYENKAKTVDILIYSGQGGRKGFGNKAEQVDQKLERGNLALANSMEREYPIRVIHKCHDKEGSSYVYDGLYFVKRFWREKDQGKFVFKFELLRISGQEKFSRRNPIESRKLKSSCKECCVVGDVSEGRENMQISVMNGVDGEKPEIFSYITEVSYPEWFKEIHQSGCDCTNGCSSSIRCRCSFKNRGEIPFTEKGAIIGPRPVVYECGPSCKCPPSCMNRVTQHGPRIKFELFKTESRGWGVRSRSYISSGSFVCEFVGKLRQIKDKQKVDCGQGRFSGFVKLGSGKYDASSAEGSSDRNETGFILDAKESGNVGRFIGYSSSPNLLIQRVLYNHDDERMPHIMMFAAKNIPPMQELTCDYDHPVDQICRFQYRL